MKPNWVIIVSAVVIVAAAFSVAFLEGANAAGRDAAQLSGQVVAN